MGGLISTIRDIKVILRDLKITLKFTAKIVLKVHGIVDDVENTVQELKTTVNNLSARVPSQVTNQEKSIEDKSAMYLNEVVHCIETTADSMKTSLAHAMSVLTSDDLLKNTSDAFESLVSHSGTNLSGAMARWASIPDEIGELVRRDCISLKDYAHSNQIKALNVKKGDKTDENQLTDTDVPAKSNGLDEKDDMTTVVTVTGGGKSNDELGDKTQKRSVREISFTDYSGKEIAEILKPLTINSHCLSVPKWHEDLEIRPTPEKRKCISRREDNSIIKPQDLMIETGSLRARDVFPESLMQFQPEILSLLVMTVLQGFSSENTKYPQKAITLLSSSQKCKSVVGQALMAEYMPCD